MSFQYHHHHVTQLVLLEQLRDIITENLYEFHEEKNEILRKL